MIEAVGLTKTFEKNTAVDHLTFEVAEGEILALLGPNGAGKTTTVRMLSSIIKPTEGYARIAGQDVVNDARAVRHLVGHLTEFPGLYLRMRALEYLDFFGELQHLPREVRHQRAKALMEQFGLGDARERRLGEYSKGMRQKMALVRAMLHEPRVLFLDEPTSAMDPLSAKQVRDAIADLRGKGHTIILCTHNLPEAELLADRIAVIRRGQLIALGTANDLKLKLLGEPTFELRLAQPFNQSWNSLNGHLHVEASGELFLRYRTSTPKTANPSILRRLHDAGAQVLSLSEMPRSLEEVYLKLVEEAAGLKSQVASNKNL
ncbi:MAG: ABC transporter ATP-binding protein [Chloroflexi bacterium]|nr:ABC transporter ATP-binding protein [Chloroflexota bacterium]